MPQRTTPFPITPELTAIAIAYRNPNLIADYVLPRVPVGKKEYRYTKVPKGTLFTLPDTKVGRTGQANRVTFSGEEGNGACKDYGLDVPVPQDDIDQAQGTQFNPLGAAVEYGSDLISLDREVRVANLVFDADNYADDNQDTLSGEDQFSDPAHSDPIGVITDALDACIMRPNTMVIGRAAFTKLATHPNICKAVFGNNTDAGIVAADAIAKLFELGKVLVGEGWVNIAKPGQDVELARVWGKHLSLLYINQVARPEYGGTFGFTAQYGTRIAGSHIDPNVGLRGGTIVRSGESVDEQIVAPDMGYFLENVVA